VADPPPAEQAASSTAAATRHDAGERMRMADQAPIV
jgi:hypothetical protein